MKRAVALLVIVLMAVGFEWGFALSPRPGAGQSDPQSSDTMFRAAITTLEYQGLKVQNRVQTVTSSRVDRQKNSTEATYTLSGEAGVRVGKDGQPAYYQSSPEVPPHGQDRGDERHIYDHAGREPFDPSPRESQKGASPGDI